MAQAFFDFSGRRTPPCAGRLAFACALGIAVLAMPIEGAFAQTDARPAAEAAPAAPGRKPAIAPAPAVPPTPGVSKLPAVGNPGQPARVPAPAAVGPVPRFDDLPIPTAPPEIAPVLEPDDGIAIDEPPAPPEPVTAPPQIATVPALPADDARSTAQPASPHTPVAAPDAALPAGRQFQVVFEGGSNELSPDDQALLTGLAARMAASETSRLQLRAYAEGASDTARDARRQSLDRALAVRGFLVAQGVRSTRIDVRALGATAPDAPADRVDLELMN